VSGEHVADFGDAAICSTPDGESLEREGGPGAIPQQVLETPKVVRHVAVDERDPHARVHRKPTVLPVEHIDGPIGVEEPLRSQEG